VPPPFQVRGCRPADAEAVAVFFASAHRADPLVGFVPVQAWRAFLAYPTNRRGRDFRLAVAGGDVVGVLTSALLAGTRHGRRRRHFRIIVHPRWRGRGVGTALLRSLEAQPLPGPRPTLQTLCPGDWSLAIDFLRNRGFREVCRDLEMERPGRAVPAPGPPRGVVLRPFGRPGDVSAWIRLHAEGFAREFHFEPWSPGRIRAELRMPGAVAIVAEAAGGPAGLVLARDLGERAGTIQSLLVSRRRRRRGVGRALLRAALAEMRRRGRRRVSLGVETVNAPAVALYASEGFRPARVDVTLWREE
jgi:ribosomal protein S18 acetylase RimI-like enzyme